MVGTLRLSAAGRQRSPEQRYSAGCRPRPFGVRFTVGLAGVIGGDYSARDQGLQTRSGTGPALRQSHPVVIAGIAIPLICVGFVLPRTPSTDADPAADITANENFARPAGKPEPLRTAGGGDRRGADRHRTGRARTRAGRHRTGTGGPSRGQSGPPVPASMASISATWPNWSATIRPAPS